MFAPINAPSFIQTVHGLSYKVVRTFQREPNEDPQRSHSANRYESPTKNSAKNPSSESTDDSHQG